MIRAVLFEDEKIFREELMLYFQNSTEIALVAAYGHANDAVKHVREHNPDIVLMDIQMPGTSGIDALQMIREAAPDMKVLMQTTFEDNHRIFVSICGGAMGYVLKDPDPEIIKTAIIEIHNGERFFSPSIAKKVYKLFLDPLVKSQPKYIPLTNRETEILQLLGKGKSRKMIASECAIVDHTVNDHFKSIYKKLHVNCAPEAVARALELKLIP